MMGAMEFEIETTHGSPAVTPSEFMTFTTEAGPVRPGQLSGLLAHMLGGPVDTSGAYTHTLTSASLTVQEPWPQEWEVEVPALSWLVGKTVRAVRAVSTDAGNHLDDDGVRDVQRLEIEFEDDTTLTLTAAADGYEVDERWLDWCVTLSGTAAPVPLPNVISDDAEPGVY